MSKYIEAERLKEKLDEHYRKYQSKYMETRTSYTQGLIDALDLAEQVIDSLQQEQPDKYETALEKTREWMLNVNQGGQAMLIDIFPELGEGLDPRYGGRKQEQPEVDFKIEERKWVHDAVDNIFPEDGDFMSEVDFRKIIKDTALHFYELGLNIRKEE